MDKRKRTNNDLQKITHQLKDRVTWTPPKTGGELMCCGMVRSSGTRRVILFTDPMISHECEKDRRVFTTSGTYRWSFNKRIQNERNCLNYEYVFNNHNLLNYYGHFHTEETYYAIDRDMTQQLQRSPLSQKNKNKQTKTNKQANKKTYFKFQAYIFIYFPNWYIFFQEMHTIFSINIKNKLSFQSFDYSFFHETASCTLDRQMSLLINKISGEKKGLFIY